MGKHTALTYQPRLLGAPEAAAYLGISATKLYSLGIPRRILDGRKLFDRFDLDAFASDLPIEGEAGGVNTCDEIMRGMP